MTDDRRASPGKEETTTSTGGDARAATGWLFTFLRPHAVRISAVLALSFLATALSLAQPYVTRYLIDDGLLAGSMRTIFLLCGAMLGLAVAGTLLSGLNRWQYVDLSARVLFAMRETVFAHLQRLSPAWYARSRGGDVLQRLDGDVAEIQRFAVDALLSLVNGLIALAGTLVLMLMLSWKLSLLALLVLPAQILFLRRMRPRVEDSTRTVRERASDLSSFVLESLGSMKLVQAVGGEARQSASLRELHETYRSDLLRQQMVGFLTTAAPGLLAVLSTAVLFTVGGWMVIEGGLSLGALIAFSIYLARASGPVQTLLGLYVATRRARVSLDRVMAVMDEQPMVAAPTVSRPLPAGARGEIAIEGASFAYEAGSTPILHRISAVFPAGRKIGLVGASGVGKSTLIDLLHRHYDPDAGRITLDGVDLRDLDPAELRRRIAVVAQDTVLLSGSIAENIRYAAPWSDDAAVMAAAEAASVTEFAGALPKGYDTPVGARGTALSGGQRQRIAIARAILQDPLVLILDEATSAVDIETESTIGAAIDRLFPDRTRLVISHRAETLAGADPIFDMGDGKLTRRPRLGAVQTER